MAKHNLASPGIPCDPISDLRVSNAGFVNCMSGGFTGSVHSQCDGGFVANFPQRTITINGTPYGPYHAGAPMPSSIGITFGGTPVTFNIGGDIINPTISVDPGTPYLGVIPIESLLEAQNTCGDIKTATASFAFIATPATPLIASIQGGSVAGSEQNATWAFNASNSQPGCCPTGVTITYLWEVFQADGVTPASNGIDYLILSGTTSSAKITIKLLVSATDYVVKLTVGNGCASDSTTTTIATDATILAAIALDSTNGTAVIVGIDGTKDGTSNIEADPNYTHTLVAYATTDAGIKVGEIFRFKGIPGSTPAADYTNSIVTSVLDQADMNAALLSTTIDTIAGGGFVVNDQTIYNVLTGINTTGTCYVPLLTSRLTIWESILTEEITSTRTSTNIAQAIDPVRCTPGRTTYIAQAEYDSVTGDYYVADLDGIKRISEKDGCVIIDTIQLATDRPNSVLIAGLHLDTTDRINELPKIYYFEGYNENNWCTLTFNGGTLCGDQRNQWTRSVLATGLSPTYSNQLAAGAIPLPAEYNVNGGRCYFLPAGRTGTRGVLIYEDPPGSWAIVNLPFYTLPGGYDPNGPGPGTAVAYQVGMGTDRWIYISNASSSAPTYQTVARARITAAGLDPTIIGNWEIEVLFAIPAGATYNTTADLAQMNQCRGLKVDTTDIVNGEPTIYWTTIGTGANDSVILRIRANTVSPATAADWDIDHVMLAGGYGAIDGTGLAGKISAPLFFSQTVNGSGKTLLTMSAPVGGRGIVWETDLGPTYSNTGILPSLATTTVAGDTDTY